MKKLHLICNAHIDPIWQWTWDEGISAAIATYKSAADLADEYDYIFCHNESLLYEDIEAKAPSLFKRIQQHVKDGKWAISGGWYIQPDCLHPCGESFIRQIQVGQEYFQQKFGVKPEIATNYDSFGYSIGLVQILKKCGYKGMLICRPAKWQFDYPSRFFNWISPDGSSIIVSNSDCYNSPLGEAALKIQNYTCGVTTGMLGAEGLNAKADMEDVDYILWGVGNHGGGPSRKDLQDIAELKINGVEIIHSTPENLFRDNIRIGGEVKTSLVTCMPGCYSTMARVKRAHREAENLFFATEKMLSVAKMAGYTPDLADWSVAEKKLLLAQFHDILPGTSIPEGEQDGLELLSMSKKIIKDYRSGAYLYLVMGEKPAANGEYPIFVFNYMPYEITLPIEAEFSIADQNWNEELHYTPYVYTEQGELLPCQTVKEGSTLNLDWRKRIVFEGKLKPMGITRFSVYTKLEPVKNKTQEILSLDSLLAQNKLLGKPLELEMYDDTADPWGMSNEELKSLGKNPKSFRLMTEEETARFCGFDNAISPIHTIENGNVLTSIECCYTAHNTNAAIVYKFYKHQPYIDLKVTLEYAEKNKLIRLKIPCPDGTVIGDGPYVVEEKPTYGEIAFQKWLGIKTDSGEVFSVINDGIYGGKAENGYLYMTLLRGAGYCIHPIAERKLYPTDRYLPRIEGGRYEMTFRIYLGDLSSVWKMAELFNQPPYALNVFPIGGGKKTSLLQTNKPVSMPVCRIEKDGYTLRFFNPDETAEQFSLQIAQKTTPITLKPHEIVTVKVGADDIQVFSDKIL